MREMTDLLVELHTLDGVLTGYQFRHLNTDERNRFYEAVLERHNTNQAQFDSSVVWYSRDPRRFERIYARVINQLTNKLDVARKENLMPDIFVALSTAELWGEHETEFTLNNRASERNELAFTIIDSALMMQDLYVLQFYQRVMPEDACTGQRIIFNIHYASGQVDSLYRSVQNDGLLRRYTFRLFAGREEKIDSLTIRFFASDSCLSAQNARIENISLTRKYSAENQQKLRIKTELAERFRRIEYWLFTTTRFNPLSTDFAKRVLYPSQTKLEDSKKNEPEKTENSSENESENPDSSLMAVSQTEL
jgi:hypothetical protein